MDSSRFIGTGMTVWEAIIKNRYKFGSITQEILQLIFHQ